MTLFMRNGKVKSTLLLNGFVMSIVFIVIYIICYGVLLAPIDHFLNGKMESHWVSFLETLICGNIGSFICCAFFNVFRDKKVILYTYCIIAIYSTVIVTGVCCSLKTGERLNFLYVALMYLSVPLCSGCFISICLYLCYKNRTQKIPIQNRSDYND